MTSKASNPGRIQRVGRLAFLLTPLVFSFVSAAEPPTARMPAAHLAVFEQHCFDCHDADTEKGGVNLEDLSFEMDSLQTAELWQKVLNTVNSGEMPPKKKEQIPDTRKAAFLSDLSRQLVVARKALADSGGKTTVRRLNRREYANTVRELTGIEPDVSDLPDDAGSGGYDTAGASLFFSSDQFEQYLKIARRTLPSLVMPGDKPERQTVRHEPEDAANRLFSSRVRSLDKRKKQIDAYRASSGGSPKDFGFIDAARVAFEERGYHSNYPFAAAYLKNPATKSGLILFQYNGGSYLDKTVLPKSAAPGHYRLRLRAGLMPGAPADRRYVEFGGIPEGTQAGEMDVHAARKITASKRKPQIIEIPFDVGPDGVRSFGLRERAHNNRAAGQSMFRAAQNKNGVGPTPSIWVDWVEWEGPLVENWPPVAHKALFFRGEKATKDSGYARAILKRFATRCFRVRLPSESYLDGLVALFKSERSAGRSFEEALIEPMAVILSSPSFLYQLEPGDPEPRALTDAELAVRLAYFLWSAPPDAELLRAARAGELAEPAALRQQTNRLLADPRCRSEGGLISGFTHQWLHMERLDFFQFNHRTYPEFDDSLRESARQEVVQTIWHLLRDNRPLGELLDSKSVVVNDMLADFYGIKGVRGAEFRSVEVPDGIPRGGLLGTAAVLAMGSDGERSSPVERGAWILRTLLHDPPPPAPANVPQLSHAEGEPRTARDALTAHTEQPQCAQCHRTIDPLGFGLENFDATGRWRTHETVLNARKEPVRLPIEPSGRLPDGSAFAGFDGLREQLAAHEDKLARSFAEGLIAYGLGRPFGFTDHDLAEALMQNGRAADFSPRAFIHALVQSPAFQSK